jgi:CubicO group peptidase (beta-lactamase class C family)
VAQLIDKTLAHVIEAGIEAGTSPGVALLVGRRREVLYEGYFGHLAPGEPQVTARTVYDLSSLTKPLATLACSLALIADKRVDFSTPVGRFLSAFDGPGRDYRRALVTLEHLAAHASGLPARRLYYEQIGERQSVEGGRDRCGESADRRIIDMASSEDLIADPGAEVRYSDVGYIVLGALVEAIAGRSLDQEFADRIAAPLGLRDTAYRLVGARRPSDADLARVAPTDACPWRSQVVRGVVQDENAYAMGGVAGHAGLFSTARDVHAIVAEYVVAYLGGAALFDPRAVERCWAGAGSVVPGSTWALGWDTPTYGSSSAGNLVSRRAFGHLGFTGTSVWVDLERDVHVVLLTNRVHPRKENERIRDFRPLVHDAVFRACDAMGR